ncbi:MAG TPA: hypothetical protein VG097_02485 [Gemmata sp.]|nr:hypothetical protein [Gemmata sp.]
MPITLSLTGQIEFGDHRLSRIEARDWLAGAAVWFESVGDAVLDAQVMRDAKEKPVLLVVLHPSPPPVEIRLGATGKVRVTAVTTPAGPGYHHHLCDILRQLANDFAFNWVADDCSDPTGFFASRNRTSLEQAFLRWLAAACRGSPKSIGLQSDHGYKFPAEVLTPLGPRTREWTTAVAAEPHCGGDFFPWWEPDLSARFYLNRGLARLWCDFVWRPPLTDNEGEVADQIANDLATAFKMNPAAEFPWIEWLELLNTIQADDEGFCVTPNDQVLSVELWRRAGPVPSSSKQGLPGNRNLPIGYRRFPIRVALDGGWSVEVPGEFAQEWDGQRNWTAWNRTRTVWFRRVGFTKPGGSSPTAAEVLDVGRRSLPDGEPVPSVDSGEVRSAAVFGAVEEEGRTVWRLSGMAGAPGQLAVCHIYTEEASDRDWAIQTWHSLRYCGSLNKEG